MIGRIIATTITACLLFSISQGSVHAQKLSQDTNVNHSAKTIFERAQKAIQESNYAEARSWLETLIDTHPDSDYVPRAKILIADSFYAQHAFRRAELEYRDFITFFPNRPEVAQVQRRLHSIHNDVRF